MGREGEGTEGWEQTETEGQFEFRARKKKKSFIFCQESHSAGKPDCFRILVSTPLPTLPVL